MTTSQTGSLAQRFARRAALELIELYGVDEARARVARRLAHAGEEDERLYADVLAALDDFKARQTN